VACGTSEATPRKASITILTERPKLTPLITYEFNNSDSPAPLATLRLVSEREQSRIPTRPQALSQIGFVPPKQQEPAPRPPPSPIGVKIGPIPVTPVARAATAAGPRVVSAFEKSARQPTLQSWRLAPRVDFGLFLTLLARAPQPRAPVRGQIGFVPLEQQQSEPGPNHSGSRNRAILSVTLLARGSASGRARGT
jgi:hypothetical protein